MLSEHTRVRNCQGCPATGLDVSTVTVDGEDLALCPDCNKRVTLGGASLDELSRDRRAA